MDVRALVVAVGLIGAAGCCELRWSSDEGEEKVAKEPAVEMPALGTRENPVRCEMPEGERAYLSRLRCPDGTPPRFQRSGSYGEAPHGNTLDGYLVECGGEGRVIYMDMYHAGYVEQEAVPGFTIVGEQSPG